MENLPTVGEAMSDLNKKGYKTDLEFETNPFGLYNGDLDMRLNPEAFHVDAIIRVDDPSNPNDCETVYAISTITGIKGTIIDEQEAEPERA